MYKTGTDMMAAFSSSISVPVMLDIGSALYGMTRKQISYGFCLVTIFLCLSEELGFHRTVTQADSSRNDCGSSAGRICLLSVILFAGSADR